MSQYSMAETETIIRRSQDTHSWDCYSAIPREVRRLRRAAAAFGGEIVELPDGAVRVTLPVTAITIRQKKSAPRPGNAQIGRRTSQE